MPRRRPQDAPSLVDLLVHTARTDPGAGRTQKTMADALGISPRTLSRWLANLHVAWPPLGRDEWQAIVNQAERVSAEPLPTWLLVGTITAANLSDVEAQSGNITILRVARLSPEPTDTGHAGDLS